MLGNKKWTELFPDYLKRSPRISFPVSLTLSKFVSIFSSPEAQSLKTDSHWYICISQESLSPDSCNIFACVPLYIGSHFLPHKSSSDKIFTLIPCTLEASVLYLPKSCFFLLLKAWRNMGMNISGMKKEDVAIHFAPVTANFLFDLATFQGWVSRGWNWDRSWQLCLSGFMHLQVCVSFLFIAAGGLVGVQVEARGVWAPAVMQNGCWWSIRHDLVQITHLKGEV